MKVSFVWFLNCCRFTYEIAPVFTLMEEVVLNRMYTLVGWHEGIADGTFAPGKNVYDTCMHCYCYLLCNVIILTAYRAPAVKANCNLFLKTKV